MAHQKNNLTIKKDQIKRYKCSYHLPVRPSARSLFVSVHKVIPYDMRKILVRFLGSGGGPCQLDEKKPKKMQVFAHVALSLRFPVRRPVRRLFVFVQIPNAYDAHKILVHFRGLGDGLCQPDDKDSIKKCKCPLISLCFFVSLSCPPARQFFVSVQIPNAYNTRKILVSFLGLGGGLCQPDDKDPMKNESVRSCRSVSSFPCPSACPSTLCVCADAKCLPHAQGIGL
jgi:hypothetical protein